MKRIVLTGATSMLGLSLIEECLKNNMEVVAIIRKNSPRKNNLPESQSIKIVECDISNLSSLENSISHGFDAFYHFAWEGTSSIERSNILLQSKNIGFTLDAVHLAHSLGCKKFIGAGSQAEYGRKSSIISTDMSVSPENAYGIAKYTAGKFSALLAMEISIEFIWTRIFSVYGQHDTPNSMIMYCAKSLLSGEKPKFTPSEQKWDYLYCHDAAKALYLLMEKGLNQKVYNIGSGIAHPLSYYIYKIRDVIDPTLPVGIGELNYNSSQVMSLHADISDLTDDTGFLPSTSFEDGILETVKWMQCEDERQ